MVIQPTDAYEWIRQIPKTDGQRIHKSLVDHYEGEFKTQTIQNAYAVIDRVQYSNGAIFTWESFSNKVTKAYKRLEKNGVIIPLSEKLRQISQKIRTQSIMFNTLAKGDLRFNQGTNHDLKWYLSQVAIHVATEFPQTHRSRPQGRIAAVDAGPHDNDDYFVETIDGRQYCNGVDITEKIRKYSPEEWSALPRKLQREIFTAKRSQDSEHTGKNRRNDKRVPGDHEHRATNGDDNATIASLATEMREMQATIASFVTNSQTGGDDVSTVTTPTVVIGNDDSNSAKRKPNSIGPPVGGLKRHRGAV